MKDGMSLQAYSFSPQYKDYLQADFVADFFSDESVVHSLNVKSMSTQKWSPLGFKANRVKQSSVPCTQTTTTVFDKLKKDEKVIRKGGSIVKCLPEFFRLSSSAEGSGKDVGEEPEVEIGNLLQKFVLKTMSLQSGNQMSFEFLDHLENDEDAESLEGLLSKEDAEEFLVQIFCHLVVGGSLCQYEDSILPYIQVATKIYKDLICVALEKSELGEEVVQVKSHVIKIHGVSQQDDSEQQKVNSKSASLIFCRTRFNNFMYMVVDPHKSLLFTFYHQVV